MRSGDASGSDCLMFREALLGGESDVLWVVYVLNAVWRIGQPLTANLHEK